MALAERVRLLRRSIERMTGLSRASGGTADAPAMRRILKREHAVYGHAEYARLAAISTAHL